MLMSSLCPFRARANSGARTGDPKRPDLKVEGLYRPSKIRSTQVGPGKILQGPKHGEPEGPGKVGDPACLFPAARAIIIFIKQPLVERAIEVILSRELHGIQAVIYSSLVQKVATGIYGSDLRPLLLLSK